MATMWYACITLVVIASARANGEGPLASELPASSLRMDQRIGPRQEAESEPATERPAPRTLDRKAAELAWRTWLQSAESRDPGAPPRRITTKSLFITPYVCPKGQRLDREGCVQIVTVNKEEHERYILEQLNALFTPAPGADVLYDYEDVGEPGPLQLTIPIGLDQPAPPAAADPSAQGQELMPTFVQFDKKDEKTNLQVPSLEAELELLKLQSTLNTKNKTKLPEITSQIILNNFLPALDKPKRDNLNTYNVTLNNTNPDDGQKEVVFGNVSVDPVQYILANQSEAVKKDIPIAIENENQRDKEELHPINPTKMDSEPSAVTTKPDTSVPNDQSLKESDSKITTTHKPSELKETGTKKLHPEVDYSDIGEAVKIISRYAEVTTDDNFAKDQRKYIDNDDSTLGTRTKLQYRRRPKPLDGEPPSDHYINQHTSQETEQSIYQDRVPSHINNPKNVNLNQDYHRYPWISPHPITPPPNYPFRHLQDYWPGRNQNGGVYNTVHENPRRHHHSFPHGAYPRPHGPFSAQPSYVGTRGAYGSQETNGMYGVPQGAYSGYQGAYLGVRSQYPGQREGYPLPRGVQARQTGPEHARPPAQDLYTVFGLRHWFSSDGSAKR